MPCVKFQRKSGREAGFCSSTRNKEIWSMAFNHSEWWIFNSWLCLPCVPFFPASYHNSLNSLTWLEVPKKGIPLTMKLPFLQNSILGKPVTFQGIPTWLVHPSCQWIRKKTYSTQLSVTVSTSMNWYNALLVVALKCQSSTTNSSPQVENLESRTWRLKLSFNSESLSIKYPGFPRRKKWP